MDSLRVLVAEGSPVYMAAVRRVLAASPAVVLAAEAVAGNQVLAEALRTQPDVAVLDVHLPGRDGFAVARELRQRTPNVKVVLLLSDDGPAYRAEASHVGARWAAKDRLVEELSRLLQSARQTAGGWAVPEGGGGVDRVNVDLGFGERRTGRVGGVVAQEWGTDLWLAAKPALVIFLIGVALLGLTALLAWDVRTPIARDGAGGSWVVDELGLLGQRGAVVRLDKGETDAYVEAQLDRHHRVLLLCVGIGVVGLAAGSALIAWHEAKGRRGSGVRRY